MSPVFRHGGLRLYLLKLLDEAPRHGYDVIKLLQDRFLGVYSPSPGTIYPRLARLEEEGLVTHDVVDGKKVYRITDAGREELSRRLDDLADLEDELSASVRDIAREISRDVRETVRNLRDEFTWAVREAGRTGYDTSRRDKPASGGAHAGSGSPGTVHSDPDRDVADRAGTGSSGTGHGGNGGASAGAGGAGASAAAAADAGTAEPGAGQTDAGEATSGEAWGHATEAGAQTSATPGASGSDEHDGDAGDRGERDGEERAGGAGRERRRPSGGWREWADWAERRDWREWAAWAEQRDWPEWAGKQEWKNWAKAGKQEWAGTPRGHETDRDLVVDLERLAAAFARELRGVAWQAEALSEDAVGNLGRILTDALNRIRNEVFRPPGSGKDES